MGGARPALGRASASPHPVDNWSDLWITVGIDGGLATRSALI